MSELKSALKILIFSAAIIFVLQLKVGPSTLEEKSMGILRDSQAGIFLNRSVEGVIRFSSSAYQVGRQKIQALISPDSGARSTNPKVREKSGTTEESEESI